MLLKKLKQFYDATRLNLRIYKDEELMHIFAASILSPDLALFLLPAALNSSEPMGFTVVLDQMFLGYVKINETNEVILMGPTFAFKPTANLSAKISRYLGLPSGQGTETLPYLQFLPLYSLIQFKEFLVLLDMLANGVSERKPSQVDLSPKREILTPVEVRTTYLEHYDVKAEQTLLSYVKYGKTDELQAIFQEWAKSSVGVPIVTKDALRSYKDIAIQANGVISRTAIAGGLDYDTVNELCSYFLIKIESLDDFEQVTEEIRRMFMTYANRVRFTRELSGDSLVVKKIQKAIHAKLHEKITPTILAGILHMDVSYLCKHFKQKTGKTISSYVNEVKIEECRRLLETTELSLGEIAVQLGFSSQYYLSAQFKKIVGCAPSKYDKSD
ncbi:MAG: helix-turn-helix transcriptional regulator [Clostridiales bacterium]|jgi:AraC-like DNA-binding protein|nr:helix-turn-helix transcriptional regulator [Clostridiales bacterium]